MECCCTSAPRRPRRSHPVRSGCPTLDSEPTAGLHALLAAHAEQDPFFTASALAAFRRARGLDEAALAAWLECPLDALHRLALRRRPRTLSEALRLATQVGANAARLAEALGLD